MYQKTDEIPPLRSNMKTAMRAAFQRGWWVNFKHHPETPGESGKGLPWTLEGPLIPMRRALW